MRERIRTRQYVMTLHAEEEMNDDAFSIFDIESGILTGRIEERQRDSSSAEWKYLIQGQSLAGDSMAVVAKIGATGRLVIITVFRA